MTERDDELARALGDLPVPDHGPDFWASLERRIDEAGSPAHDPLTADRTGDGAPVAIDGAHDGRLSHPRHRRRRPPPVRRLLLAAAALAVAVAGVAVLTTRDDGSADHVATVADDGTAPGPTVAPFVGETEDGAAPGPSAARSVPTSPPAGDPGAMDGPEALGPGLVVGALPAADGSVTVLVRDLLPSGGTGCEGAALEGLLVLRPDGSTRPVTAADGSAIVNGADVHPSPTGDRVAVTSVCEGFLGQLLVGVVGPDGLPGDLQAVAGSRSDGSPVPGAPEVEAMPSITWSADGATLLATTVATGGDGSVERALWSYDVATGTWTERTDAPDGVVAAVQRADGSVVAITDRGLVIEGEDGDQPRRGANRLALGPDGMTVVAYGSDGLLLIDETGGVRFLTGGAITRAQFRPDGSGLIAARVDDGSGRIDVVSLPLDGTQPEPSLLGTTPWGWFEVLPDATGVLVTVDGAVDAASLPRPAVERWPVG